MTSPLILVYDSFTISLNGKAHKCLRLLVFLIQPSKKWLMSNTEDKKLFHNKYPEC